MIESSFQGDIREVPISVLAYIGDAVYELTVRLHLCSQSSAKSGALHRRSVQLVRATAQAEAARKLLPILTDWHHVEPVPLFATYPSGRNLSPKVRAMVDFLVDEFGGAPWRQGRR